VAPRDVLRHSYGSYWLVKHKNRAQLAENMGTPSRSSKSTTSRWSQIPP